MKIYVNKGNYGWQTRAVNGEDKLYIDVGFKKDMEPDEMFCRIEIIDGFFTLYKTKTGLAKPKLIIMDYKKISKEDNINDEVMAADDSILPF